MKRASFAIIALLGGALFVSCDKNSTSADSKGVYDITATTATAWYKGVGVVNGKTADFDTYLLSLQSSKVEFNDNGYTGVGTAFLIDMNTPTNGGKVLRLAPGTYSLLSADSEAEDYVFYAGSENKGEVGVSYVYFRESEKTVGNYYPITGGSFTVETGSTTANVSKYTISGSFETPHGTFNVSYSGTPAFADATSGDDSGDDSGDGETTKIDVSGFKYGYAYHYGLAWSGITVEDYADWYVILGQKKGFDIENDVCLYLDILTAAGYKEEIPVGKYEYIDEVSDETVAPFKLVYGDVDEDDYCYGTWYYGECVDEEEGEYEYFGATDGYVTVSKADGKYHFEVNFEDSFENGEVTGSITLESLEFSDKSSSYSTESASVKGAFPALRRQAAGGVSLRHIGAAKARKVKSGAAEVPAFVAKNFRNTEK